MSRLTKAEGLAIRNAVLERIKALEAKQDKTNPHDTSLLEVLALITGYNKLKDGLRDLAREL